jgi:hypothetical protein
MRKQAPEPTPIFQAQPKLYKRSRSAFEVAISASHMKARHRLLTTQITRHVAVRCATDILPNDLIRTYAIFIKADFTPTQWTGTIEIHGHLIIYFYSGFVHKEHSTTTSA